jgi:hypothetical protein
MKSFRMRADPLARVAGTEASDVGKEACTQTHTTRSHQQSQLGGKQRECAENSGTEWTLTGIAGQAASRATARVSALVAVTAAHGSLRAVLP